MKKIIYTLLITFAASIAFTSCTEEEVAPSNSSEYAPGGGGKVGSLN